MKVKRLFNCVYKDYKTSEAKMVSDPPAEQKYIAAKNFVIALSIFKELFPNYDLLQITTVSSSVILEAD